MPQQPKRLKLVDLPQIAPHQVAWENSCFACHTGWPCWFDPPQGVIVVEPQFQLLGWCPNPPDWTRQGDRADWIVLVFHRRGGGDVWCHYPLDTEHKREQAVFEHRTQGILGDAHDEH